MLVVGGWGDRQHGADRLDPVLGAVVFDEVTHDLGRRSSSACAKYAEALRRISLARFSSRTSRSRSLSRSRSPLVSPGRLPASRWVCRTHLRNVSAVQPIFDAIDVIAAHSESCEGNCSNTSRTARSRTSGGYLLGLPMAPSSQHWEPPEKPGRFTQAWMGRLPSMDGKAPKHGWEGAQAWMGKDLRVRAIAKGPEIPHISALSVFPPSCEF